MKKSTSYDDVKNIGSKPNYSSNECNLKCYINIFDSIYKSEHAFLPTKRPILNNIFVHVK